MPVDAQQSRPAWAAGVGVGAAIDVGERAVFGARPLEDEQPVSALIRTWHLEMTSPDRLRPTEATPADVELRQAAACYPELAYFLYSAVGGDWYWIDRVAWSYDDWVEYLDGPSVEVWILLHRGTPAGYAELTGVGGDEVQIASFGLIPRFIGRGLGGWFLTQVIRRAWECGRGRVRVNTCSLDGPAALPNYRARGFEVVRVDEDVKLLPPTPLGPWGTLRHPVGAVRAPR